MNYKKMSYFEVNKAVATAKGLTEWSEQWLDLQDRDENVFLVASNDSREVLAKDYCNNPSDAWPVMNDARIEIKRDTCQVRVSSYFNPDFVIHCRNDETEILYSAMICFLKMKDAEKC